MSRKLINWIIFLAVLILGGFFLSTQLKKNKQTIQDNAALSQVTNASIPVKVAMVTEENFGQDFEVDGTFAPFKSLTVIADVNGKVTQLPVDNGSFVNQGGLIAAVDNTLLNNQLKSVELNKTKAARDLQRLKNLFSEGGSTQSQLDDLQLAIDQYDNQIATLKKQISDTYIKAPIGGTVTNKKIERGAFIGAGTPVVDLVNIGQLKFKAYLTEAQVFRVKQGASVQVSTDLYDNQFIPGKVSFIDVQTGPGNTYLVEILCDNPARTPLKAGVSGTARFSTGATIKGLSVPRVAVTGSLRDAKVYVVENNKATLRNVKIGKILGDKVQILEGLEAGQQVVTNGQINLDEGTKVNVASAEK